MPTVSGSARCPCAPPACPGRCRCWCRSPAEHPQPGPAALRHYGSVTSQISEESRPAAEPEEAPDPRRWKALAVCLAGGFMVLLDISIVNVALPSMAHG